MPLFDSIEIYITPIDGGGWCLYGSVNTNDTLKVKPLADLTSVKEWADKFMDDLIKTERLLRSPKKSEDKMRKQKTVDGFYSNGTELHMCPVTVRLTADEIGQTLSLEQGSFMIGISLLEVRDMLQIVQDKKEAVLGKTGLEDKGDKYVRCLKCGVSSFVSKETKACPYCGSEELQDLEKKTDADA